MIESRQRGRALGARGWRIGIAAAAFCAMSAAVTAGEGAQSDYATPDAAATAFVTALRTNDQQALLAILGPEGEKLIHSGDEVADRRGRERVVAAYDKGHKLQIDKDTATLIVGAENWAVPIPIARKGARWQFDTVASAQKIIDRRVGRNELSVIEVCRAYVTAQREYASESPLGKGLHQYAQKFDSSPGQHDGLYWEAESGQPQSPFGPLIAHARAHGYTGDDQAFKPAPYHGYFYRILTRQGAHAPGGAKDYVVSGRMTKGFALLAFPARWGDSGIMTFVVNQDGIVFQKNLGPETEQLAQQINEYDPDSSWTTP
jgi:DUF2950 family protein